MNGNSHSSAPVHTRGLAAGSIWATSVNCIGEVPRREENGRGVEERMLPLG